MLLPIYALLLLLLSFPSEVVPQNFIELKFNVTLICRNTYTRQPQPGFSYLVKWKVGTRVIGLMHDSEFSGDEWNVNFQMTGTVINPSKWVIVDSEIDHNCTSTGRMIKRSRPTGEFKKQKVRNVDFAVNLFESAPLSS